MRKPSTIPKKRVAHFAAQGIYYFANNADKQARRAPDGKGWEVRHKAFFEHDGWGKWVPYAGIGEPRGLLK